MGPKRHTSCMKLKRYAPHTRYHGTNMERNFIAQNDGPIEKKTHKTFYQTNIQKLLANVLLLLRCYLVRCQVFICTDFVKCLCDRDKT